MQEHRAVFPHHPFSLSTNPWSRSPGEPEFGTSQLIMILAEEGNVKAKQREESSIPVLIPAKQWAESPSNLKSKGRKNLSLVNGMRPFLPQLGLQDCLIGAWNDKIRLIHFQPDAYYSSQHLDHKMAFHFNFLTTLRVKEKFQSREYFYLPEFFNAHEAQLQKYDFFYYRLDILVLFSRTETWKVGAVFAIGI